MSTALIELSLLDFRFIITIISVLYFIPFNISFLSFFYLIFSLDYVMEPISSLAHTRM